MCAQSQSYSRTEHILLGIARGDWRKVQAVMFNVYFDDSGTAPSQRFAIAAALIIPGNRVRQLENEWNKFLEKYEIADFHTSVCVYKNRKHQFADWDDEKVNRAVARVRQITIKYAVRAISYAVSKKDFDELVPDRWKEFVGKDHYAWAVRHALRVIQRWSTAAESRYQLEYFFDFARGNTKKAIEKAMADAELLSPGNYEGHYVFGKRQEIPGLQCADLFAWACLGGARHTFENTPIHPIAESTIRAYRNHSIQGWMIGGANSREALRASLQKNLGISVG
jgi:hypothetical protein